MEPVTGGANLPALNELLGPLGVSFGSHVLRGELRVGGHTLTLGSAAPIARLGAGGWLVRAPRLHDEAAKLTGILPLLRPRCVGAYACACTGWSCACSACTAAWLHSCTAARVDTPMMRAGCLRSRSRCIPVHPGASGASRRPCPCRRRCPCRGGPPRALRCLGTTCRSSASSSQPHQAPAASPPSVTRSASTLPRLRRRRTTAAAPPRCRAGGLCRRCPAPSNPWPLSYPLVDDAS